MYVEVWAIISKIAKCYALIMIYNRFYKHEACADNYDYSHCYASCVTSETEKYKYYPIDQKICVYYGSNELSPDSVCYWGNIVATGKLWSI